jgi:hypothetical protein
MRTKICGLCKNEKDLESFGKCSASKDGRGRWCKECRDEYHKKRYYDSLTYNRNRAREAARQRKLRQTPEHKEYDRKFRKQYNATFSGMVSNLLQAARCRAKKAGQDMDIDRQWVADHLKPMICEATGVELVLTRDETVAHTAFRPSIDRIDNQRGYTKDNCRIVSVIYNKAKSEYNDADVLKMARNLVLKFYEAQNEAASIRKPEAGVP